MVGGTVAVCTNGSDFSNTAGMRSGNPMEAFGPMLMGASSVGSGLVSATPSGPGAHAMSPKSGSIRGATTGVGSIDTVLVATSLFGGVTVGSSGAHCFDGVT